MLQLLNTHKLTPQEVSSGLDDTPARGTGRPRRGAAAADAPAAAQQQAPASHRHHRRQGNGGTTSAQQDHELLTGGKQAPLQPLGQAFPGRGGARYTADSDTIMEAVVKVTPLRGRAERGRAPA